MLMKKGLPLILVSIVILSISFWISAEFLAGMATPTEKLPENSNFGFNDANFSKTKLPPELRHNLAQLEDELHFTVGKWEFDPEDNTTINLYAHDIRNESMMRDIQGKQIGTYAIRIIHDSEFEVTRSEVFQQLMQYREDPAYQIANVAMITDYNRDPSEYYAELWAYNSTPENKKLDNTVIRGWKILVYPMTKSIEMQKKISGQANANSSPVYDQTG